MKNQVQKGRERHFVESFLRGIEIPIGVLLDFEEPDFLYTYMDDKVLGIEVTEIHNSKGPGKKFTPSQRHGTLEKIVKKAETEYFQRVNLALNINISFAKDLEITTRRSSELATELADIVANRVENSRIEQPFNLRIERDLPKEINDISGYFFPGSTTSIWYSGEGAFLPGAQPEEISKLLTRKERLLKSYRSNCDEIWLLIVEGIPPYSWFNDFDVALNARYVTGFDRFFIYRNLHEQTLELGKKIVENIVSSNYSN